MNSVKKIALVGGVLIISTALLVSFTKDNGGDKMKKYQIIHHSSGEVITHDTILPMTSSFTPEQYVAEMGISSDHIEVINVPAISEMDTEGKVMKTFVHEMEIEDDGEGSEETVEIRVEMDENGEMTTKKTVNGVEVEMTEDELQEIKSHHGEHGKMIQMRINDEEMGGIEERIEISVNMDNEGNKTIRKIVNGEEVEISEDEMENIQMFELMDGDDVNIFVQGDEMDVDMKALEIEIEKLIEEGGDDVKVITKRIEINSDSDDFDFESKDGKQRVMVMSSDDTEDHTIVLVTENYDENAATQTKMMFESSKEEMDVFPNPNDGTFKIRYESDENEKTSITVTDASGKKVFEENLGKFSGSYEKELNLKEFGSGMYTITIQNGKNEEVQKVMIK